MFKSLSSFYWLVPVAIVLFMIAHYQQGRTTGTTSYSYAEFTGGVNPDFNPLRDSILNEERNRRGRMMIQGSGTGMFSIGFRKITTDYNGASSVPRYYISLDQYRAREPVDFSLDEKGMTHYRYRVIDSIRNGKGRGHIEEGMTRVRFAHDTWEGNKKGVVLIPVSYSSYWIFQVLIYLVMAIVLFLSVFYLVLRPLQVLSNIAKGDSFNEKNHRYLFTAGITLIVLTVLSLLVSLIADRVFNSQIPPVLDLSVGELLGQLMYAFLGSLVLLLAARAFRKGSRLQEEQDLTV